MSAQEIREIALKIFSEKGYDDTTLADIANAIGIKKPSIYAHYPSKMELFLTVLNEVKADYYKCWSDAFTATAYLTVDNQLKSIFFSVANYFLANRQKLHFWVRIWMFPPADCGQEVLSALQEQNNRLIDKIAAIFQQGIDSGIFIPESARELAHVYFCVLDGYLSRIICYPRFDYNKSLAIVWNSFLSGPLKINQP